MKKIIVNFIKITIYYFITLILIYKIIYFIWINYIFQCNIENPKDLDCIDIVFNSVLLSIIFSVLFLIIDWILFKSYKKFYSFIWKK